MKIMKKLENIKLYFKKIQGLKVYYTKSFASNLIDIEVVYIHNTNISGRLLVEGEQIIDTLNNSIKDMLEIFPKLSGLDGLEVTNLRKKDGNGWTELIPDNKIKNHIKQKDVIYFDLKFTDVWIDVIMTVKDRDDETKTNKISFELKKELKGNDSELELTLINLGIRSWKQFKEEEDFYLVSKFEIISETKQIEKKNPENLEQDKNSQKNLTECPKNTTNIMIGNEEEQKFSFDDKIECSLIFINFSNYIYKYSVNEVEKKKNNIKENDEEKDSKIEYKMHDIKNYFNQNFKELYLDNSQKIVEEDRILCKVSENYHKNEEDEMTIYPLYYNYYSINNNTNFKQRFVGPFKHKASVGKKNIEMDEIRNDSGKFIFKDTKNLKIESFSNDSSFSMKSFTEEFHLKNKENEEQDSENNNSIEEINVINKIIFDDILDKLNTYILNKKFNESDVYRTRNLNILDGEILKINKLNPDKEYEKKNSKVMKNSEFPNEEEFSYNNRLIKKYSALFIAIIIILIIIKIFI